MDTISRYRRVIGLYCMLIPMTLLMNPYISDFMLPMITFWNRSPAENSRELPSAFDQPDPWSSWNITASATLIAGLYLAVLIMMDNRAHHALRLIQSSPGNSPQTAPTQSERIGPWYQGILLTLIYGGVWGAFFYTSAAHPLPELTPAEIQAKIASCTDQDCRELLGILLQTDTSVSPWSRLGGAAGAFLGALASSPFTYVAFGLLILAGILYLWRRKPTHRQAAETEPFDDDLNRLFVGPDGKWWTLEENRFGRMTSPDRDFDADPDPPGMPDRD